MQSLYHSTIVLPAAQIFFRMRKMLTRMVDSDYSACIPPLLLLFHARSATVQQSADCTGFDAKIAVRDLTKMYGDLVVLDKINFSIKRGELVSIVGPTGCGKTTFLKMCIRDSATAVRPVISPAYAL